MKLKKLIVKNLFGHFNHVIPFHEEHATIITAPNGYGKTIVLKIVDAIFNRNFGFLVRIDFSMIELITSEGNLVIKKSAGDEGEGENKGDMTISIDGDTPYQYRYAKIIENLKQLSPHVIEAEIPFLTRMSKQKWLDDRSGKLVDFDYIIDNYSEMLPVKFQPDEDPEWLNLFTSSLKSHFIQDQRLVIRTIETRYTRKINFVDTIEKYADELAEKIRDSSNNSSKISQQLDTTFPVRLLDKGNTLKSPATNDLKEQLKQLQKKREILAKYNLLSSERQIPDVDGFDEITDSDAKVLTLYVEDTTKKLESYDKLLQKIELFSSILNNKRLSFKKINIDPDKGFMFETDKEQPLKLTQLSSGEQHQVVLLYELIFKTQEDVLVLIDEPEISLHVAWQKDFLDDLKQIIDIQNMVVVVATHSPQIIDNNWELVVDLEGAYA